MKSRLRGYASIKPLLLLIIINFNQHEVRDGPLEKLWGGEGNFRAARIFFRYQILCMNFI